MLKKLNLEKKSYYLASFHREENVDIPDNFSKILNVFNCIAEKYQKKLSYLLTQEQKINYLKKKLICIKILVLSNHFVLVII